MASSSTGTAARLPTSRTSTSTRQRPTAWAHWLTRRRAHARNVAFETNGGSYFEDAGFAKLRELSVSFVLPKTLTQSLFSSLTQDVRLEISGRNLHTWTGYSGYDPEVSNFSNQNIGRFQDVTPYPPSRSFFVSLSTNF